MRKSPPKSIEPASGGRLEDGELFEAQFGAELRSMASASPAQIVGKNVAVLVFDGGQVFRGANGRGAIAEADRRQAADVLACRERNSRERESRREFLRETLSLEYRL